MQNQLAPSRSDEAEGTPAVTLREVSHSYTGSLEALSVRQVSLEAHRGEFVAIVGPSGCGKSTLLSITAGLADVVDGEVFVAGERVTGVRKDVGFIFQRDALLPWRTVLQNVELPLKFRKVKRAEVRDRARTWLSRMGLDGYEDRFPHQLSGGQRKRVAIAATMVYEPTVLLMDEPFSALDVQTREMIENDILKVWQESGKQTVLFVTHDLEEAIGLSDRVVVITAGPGTVLASYDVTLDRPRDIMEAKLGDDFRDLYRTIWADLSKEVMRANRIPSRDQ